MDSAMDLLRTAPSRLAAALRECAGRVLERWERRSGDHAHADG